MDTFRTPLAPPPGTCRHFKGCLSLNLLFWVKLCRFVVIMRKTPPKAMEWGWAPVPKMSIALWHFHSEDLRLATFQHSIASVWLIANLDCIAQNWSRKLSSVLGWWICIGVCVYLCCEYSLFVFVDFNLLDWILHLATPVPTVYPIPSNVYFCVHMFCDLDLIDCSLISCESGLRCRVLQIP